MPIKFDIHLVAAVKTRPGNFHPVPNTGDGKTDVERRGYLEIGGSVVPHFILSKDFMTARTAGGDIELRGALPDIAGGLCCQEVLFIGRVIIKSDRLSGMKTIQRRGDSRADGSAPAAQNDFRLWNIKFGLCQDNTGTPMNTDNVVSGYDFIRYGKSGLGNTAPGDSNNICGNFGIIKIQRKSIAAVGTKARPADGNGSAGDAGWGWYRNRRRGKRRQRRYDCCQNHDEEQKTEYGRCSHIYFHHLLMVSQTRVAVNILIDDLH